MTRLSGFSEEKIKIVFTGLRPGEKLYEEVLADRKRTLPASHPKVRVAQSRAVAPGWLDKSDRRLSRESSLQDGGIKKALRQWVLEYATPAAPLSDGKPTHAPGRNGSARAAEITSVPG